MRAVDTNLVVRYLIGDDPRQAARAGTVIDGGPVFVPRTVLLEVEWVLRGVYDLPPGRLLPALRAFAGHPNVSVEDATIVATALDWCEDGLDFADALHLAASHGAAGFLTFDKRLIRAASRIGAVPVPTEP